VGSFPGVALSSSSSSHGSSSSVGVSGVGSFPGVVPTGFSGCGESPVVGSEFGLSSTGFPG